MNERNAFVSNLRAMQDKKTGLLFEKTHNTIHTTAHCMAALELFDAAPEFRAFELERYLSSDALDEFLTSLDWENKPWSQSHCGAGRSDGAGIISHGWVDSQFVHLRKLKNEKSRDLFCTKYEIHIQGCPGDL